MKKNNKIAIAIYPGFFNPFHKQHEKIVRQLIKNRNISQIGIFINQKSEYKNRIIPGKTRGQIINGIFKNTEKVIIKKQPAPYITNQLFSEIIDSFKAKNHQFGLVVGSDQGNSMEEGKEIAYLKTKTNFFVAERAGHPLKKHHQLNEQMHKIALKPSANASTEIRNGINGKGLNPQTRKILFTKQYYFANILQRNLDFNKYQHVQRVYQMAKKINNNFNLKQEGQNLYFACLFHDLTKHGSREKHLKFCQKHQINKMLLEKLPFPIGHSKTSAGYLEKELQFKQPRVIQAINFHTTSNAKMSTLAKLLFVADKIEIKKNDNNAKQIRKILKKVSFQQLFRLTLQAVYTQLIKGQKIPTPATMAAVKYYLEK